MIIRNLKLRNFRNYETVSIDLCEGMNILTGDNAQGKTNLLESLVYLSLTRSHRISNEKKLVRENMPFADITCQLSDGDDRQIRAIIHSQGKTLLINDSPVRKSSDFIGQLNVVLFAPDDLYIFTDHPRERRRIMNQEITKISNQYLISLNMFQNLLKERNIILKRDRADEKYLDILDEQMSECEALIIRMRRQFAEEVNEAMIPLYRELSGDTTVQAGVRYRCCINDEEAIRENVLAMHRQLRERDLENRMTVNGIQREDLIFEMNGTNLIQTASQGQKRMTMLAFKMALLKYIRRQTGKQPVLLLDDVLSELDGVRRKKLLEMVQSPCQCLITATDIPDEIRKGSFREFRIDHGTVSLISGGKQ